ncbi:hypothetical protein [Shinella kummerowiae]|jgi:hypothetical protein|uniref:hypothetical protein n=1 Tax=Shinella kummerowiae TaxID=417745 RepID=UPI0021B6339C|nr:hypothetical protein [Shinella kummerowiae]MCT7662863.1 hypothetical protein [Shinella kummerowiae]
MRGAETVHATNLGKSWLANDLAKHKQTNSAGCVLTAIKFQSLIAASATFRPALAGDSMSENKDFHALLRAICVGYGHCGSLQDDGYVHVTHFVPERGKVSVDDFIDWVFMAEGDEWFGYPRAMMQREKLRSCFIGYMGSSVVSARRLRRKR